MTSLMYFHVNFLFSVSQIQCRMDHFLHPGLGNPLTMEFLHDGNDGKLSNISGQFVFF